MVSKSIFCASITACVRDVTLSLRKISETWALTVGLLNLQFVRDLLIEKALAQHPKDAQLLRRQRLKPLHDVAAGLRCRRQLWRMITLRQRQRSHP